MKLAMLFSWCYWCYLCHFLTSFILFKLYFKHGCCWCFALLDFIPAAIYLPPLLLNISIFCWFFSMQKSFSETQICTLRQKNIPSVKCFASKHDFMKSFSLWQYIPFLLCSKLKTHRITSSMLCMCYSACYFHFIAVASANVHVKTY